MPAGPAAPPWHSTFSGSAPDPLIILAALVVGLVALISLPRGEEPQNSVPLVDFIRHGDHEGKDMTEVGAIRFKPNLRTTNAAVYRLFRT